MYFRLRLITLSGNFDFIIVQYPNRDKLQEDIGDIGGTGYHLSEILDTLVPNVTRVQLLEEVTTFNINDTILSRTVLNISQEI